MKQLRNTAISLLLASLSINTQAESEYHVDSRLLTIPSVKVKDSHVYDAKLKLNELGSFDIISYSDKPIGNVDAKCTTHVTHEKYKQLQDGMALEQVNNIVGCQGRLFGSSRGVDIYHWEGADEALIIATIVKGMIDEFGLTFIPPS